MLLRLVPGVAVRGLRLRARGLFYQITSLASRQHVIRPRFIRTPSDCRGSVPETRELRQLRTGIAGASQLEA